MTIRKKLFYGFNGVILLAFVLAVVNFAALERTRKAKDNTTRGIQLLDATAHAELQMATNRLNLANYLLSGSPTDEAKVERGVSELRHQLSAAGSLAPEAKSNFERAAAAEQDWQVSFAHALILKRHQVDAGNSSVAELQVYYLNLDPASWIEKSTAPLKQAESAALESLTAQSHSDDRASNIMFVLSIVFAILAIAGGSAIAFWTAKSITEPLARLIEVAREIAESGNLNQTIDIERSDEIGALAHTFRKMVVYLKEMASIPEAIVNGDLTREVRPRSNRDTLGNSFLHMTAGLRKVVRQIRDGAAQVSGGSNQVAAAAEDSAKINLQAASAIDEVTSAMHEISVNVQSMVKNTQVQATNVSETSSSINQMVASIQRVADTARTMVDISTRSKNEVQSGLETMNKAADGLTRINASIQTSSSIIGELDARAENIGRIVGVIDDLAEQTNLLALNAAIEAARAGEHGLGFAVVADEVRKLAEKSAQSTREISDLIQNIQKEARRAVQNMEQSSAIVTDGLVLGTELSGALQRIATVVSEVAQFAQQIGVATHEQSNGSAQIARSTTQLNNITQEIGSSVEEQASGADSVARAMEKLRELTQRSSSGSTELASSADQMSKMATGMMSTMGRFVLERSASSAEEVSTFYEPQAVAS